MEYTVDYFIEKFEAIPEEKWVDNATNFAYTICGQYEYAVSNECVALSDLFKKLNLLTDSNRNESYHGYCWTVCDINDGNKYNTYPQPTPKQRILAALYDIKTQQNNVDAAKETLTETQLVHELH